MHLPALPREACGAKVLSPYESTIEMGAQSQALCHVISKKTVACTQISAGLIVMPPHKVARPHLHQAHEMVLFILEGWGAALVGPDLKPIYHVYARFNFFQSDDVRFYQIPDQILLDFGLTATDAFNNESAVA